MIDRLDDLLRSVPREKASEGFSEGVLARRQRRSSQRRAWRRQIAAVVLGIVLASGGGAMYRQHREDKRMTELRAEHARLQRDLDQLKKLTENYPSVIYLGSTDEEAVVLDARTTVSGDSNTTVSNEF